MIEFEIDGRHYRFEKPNAMEQLHLSRKLAPLLPALAPVLDRVWSEIKKSKATGGGEGELSKALEENFLDLAQLAKPFADQLAAMKSEDAEFVFELCLGVMWVNHNGNWITFWSRGGRMPMVMELNDPALLLRLVLRVIKESLGNFMQGFLTSAQEPVPTKV